MSGLHTVTSKLMLQATILLLIYSSPVLAETNAESWSKSTGALFGMAALCGHPPSDQWIKNVVRQRAKLSSGDVDDLKRSSELFEAYAKSAYLMQAGNPSVNCSQVIEMMKQSEEKWGN